MDTKNTLTQHLVVGFFTLLFAWLLNFYLAVSWSTSFARVSFLLLFLTLIIGPITKLKSPSTTFTPLKLPWTWRSELGIWFTITAILHVFFAVSNFGGGGILDMISSGGFGLANFLGLVALFWALILTATSFRKVIVWIGVESWKWLHKFTYVVFYLVSAHLAYFQFFSDRADPDWFGYSALVMIILVIVLQLIAFMDVTIKNKKENN